MSKPPKSDPAAGDSSQKQESASPVGIGDDRSEAVPQIHSDFPRIHRFWKRTKQVADFVGPTAFIIGIVFAIMAWIDFDIGRRLGDETTLRKIAAHSRPSLIFDAKESVIADMGALQYIDPKDIHIIKRTTEGWPQRIHVGFARSLSIPPILTSLYDSAQIRAERGKGLDWEFEISWSVEPMSKDDKDRLYRLEIIP
jgi:hypothetical protein